MKNLTSLVLLTFVCFATFAKDEKPYLTKIFKASSITALEVKTSGGGIFVEGGNNSEARVEVYIKANNWKDEISEAEIEERLKNYTLSVEKDGSTLRCIAKNKESNMNWKKALSISFKVYVAQKVATNLSTSGGGIAMKNLKGEQRFRTSGGGLKLTDLKGDINGSTSGGGIDLVNCDDQVNVQTSGGGITATGCDGEINLRTSGGGLKLTDLSGTVKATTSGGGITAKSIKGELYITTSGGGIRIDDMKGNVRASTSGGGIDASISSLDDFVELTTSAGNVDVRLPSGKGLNLDLRGNKVEADNCNNFSGTKEKTKMRGQVDGGGTNIKISANSGSIQLTR